MRSRGGVCCRFKTGVLASLFGFRGSATGLSKRGHTAHQSLTMVNWHLSEVWAFLVVSACGRALHGGSYEEQADRKGSVIWGR